MTEIQLSSHQKRALRALKHFHNNGLGRGQWVRPGSINSKGSEFNALVRKGLAEKRFADQMETGMFKFRLTAAGEDQAIVLGF